MNRFRLVLVPLAVAAAAAASCTPNADTGKLQKMIKEYFAKAGPVDSVTCPKNVKLKKGESFTCKIKFTGGDEFKVDGVVSEAHGNEGTVSYSINEPIFPALMISAQTADEMKKKNIDATLDCGAVRHPKATETCKAKLADGSAHDVVITLDAKGNPTNWEMK